jgi:aminopeptidase N
VLDTHALVIEEVTGGDGTARHFRLEPEVERFGEPLVIELASADREVRVRYRTTARSEALQWLAPAQTADGTDPFLFTQGESILTRSWIPLQDSPGVRVSYDARVRCPRALTR